MSELESISRALSGSDIASEEFACRAFHDFCLAQLPSLGERGSPLEVGHALAPADAARCVLDHARTARLVRALDARIAERLTKADEARVLYAGCGPLAPLALLLTHRWSGRRVIFDLVDIHPESISSARRLFELAGAAQMLGDLHCADAATLQLTDETRPHILVAEVMQRALAREPQVAVVANLLPQCEPGAALVPERIAVHAMLAPPAEPSRAAPLGHLLTVAVDTVPALAAAIHGGAHALPEVVLRVPDALEAGQGVWLATHIDAGPGEVLRGDDSGLTTPLFLAELGIVAPGETLGFSYRLGRAPGFVVRRLDFS